MFASLIIIAIFYFRRYQFYLQIKQDILQGRLPIPFDLTAELGAYAVQCKSYEVVSIIFFVFWIKIMSHINFSKLS